MLRLKKSRRQRDQTAASTTKFVAQGAGERHRGFVGTLDERSGPTAGRRDFGGRGLPSTGKTPSQESDTRANADTGRSRTAAIDPETCAELELRHTGTRSARQLGVSRVHADRRRESAGCEDTGTTGTSHWAGRDWEATWTIDGVGARAGRGARAEDEGGHDGGGDEHPLSDRQQFVRGWCARADADDEEGREYVYKPSDV